MYKSLESVLVTGGWGYIGSNLVEKLCAANFKVTVIDPFPPNKNKEHLLKKVKWINDSIKNIEKYDLSADYIFHLAGIANVKLSVENPLQDLNINLLETIHLLEWARNNMIKKIIFSSSVSVIGTNIQSPVSEEISCSPVSPYGASKSSSENYMIAYFNSYGIPIVIARLFNVYGPGQKKLFFADIIKKLEINKDEVELWGGGNQIRDYLHIDDVIDGLIFLAQNGKKGEIYNLSSGIPVKLIDLTLLIAKHFTNSIPNIVSTKTFKGDISGWYGCTKKIQDLGFYPKVKLDQGVSKSVKWYHENKDWYK